MTNGNPSLACTEPRIVQLNGLVTHSLHGVRRHAVVLPVRVCPLTPPVWFPSRTAPEGSAKKMRFHAKEAPQAERGLSAHTPLSAHDFVNPLWRHADLFG